MSLEEAVWVGSPLPGASSPCKQLSFSCLVLLLVAELRDRKTCLVAVLKQLFDIGQEIILVLIFRNMMVRGGGNNEFHFPNISHIELKHSNMCYLLVKINNSIYVYYEKHFLQGSISISGNNIIRDLGNCYSIQFDFSEPVFPGYFSIKPYTFLRTKIWSLAQRTYSPSKEGRS